MGGALPQVWSFPPLGEGGFLVVFNSPGRSGFSLRGVFVVLTSRGRAALSGAHVLFFFWGALSPLLGGGVFTPRGAPHPPFKFLWGPPLYKGGGCLFFGFFFYKGSGGIALPPKRMPPENFQKYSFPQVRAFFIWGFKAAGVF